MRVRKKKIRWKGVFYFAQRRQVTHSIRNVTMCSHKMVKESYHPSLTKLQCLHCLKTHKGQGGFDAAVTVIAKVIICPW